MAGPLDFNSDDVLGFEEEVDPRSGERTGVLRVLLKDGTDRRFSDAEADGVRKILMHSTPPTA